MSGDVETTEAGAVLGTLPTLTLPMAPPWPAVAAYTPAAVAERAMSAIATVIMPVRKLISSSQALTTARRPG